jgi:AsmA protein
LRVGLFTAFNVKATQLRVGVKARDGVLTVNPLSAYLYQGSTEGSITVNASQSIPSFLINENLSGINTEELVRDVVGLDILQGRGNVAAKLTTQGNTVGGLKKALNGNMSINLHEGAIKGIDIAKLVNQVQSLNQNSTMQTLKPNDSDKTAFSEFKASFKIKNGVAHNDDLLVNSPVLKLTGKGDIDIGNNGMDYTARAAELKSEGGVSGTLPVRLSGPFTALKYDVDYAAMLADVAKQKLDEIKANEKHSLKRRLKGLFNK